MGCCSNDQFKCNVNKSKSPLFNTCRGGGGVAKSASHCANEKSNKYPILPIFVMVCISIVIINDSQFSGIRIRNKVWSGRPYHVYRYYIQNSIPSNSFEFMCCIIKFPDNRFRHKKGRSKYNAVIKVKYVIDLVIKVMTNAWVFGGK